WVFEVEARAFECEFACGDADAPHEFLRPCGLVGGELGSEGEELAVEGDRLASGRLGRGPCGPQSAVVLEGPVDGGAPLSLEVGALLGQLAFGDLVEPATKS